MDDFPFWLSIGLAALLALVILSTASCLFLLRRLDGLARAFDATEQRVVQLAYEVRRLEFMSTGEGERATPTLSKPRQADADAAPLDSLISVPDLADAAPPHRESGENHLAEKHADVWAMVEAGRSAQEIAQETGRPIGQIELIVGLYRQHLAALSQGFHDHSS